MGTHKCLPIGNIKYSNKKYNNKHMNYLGENYYIDNETIIRRRYKGSLNKSFIFN